MLLRRVWVWVLLATVAVTFAACDLRRDEPPRGGPKTPAAKGVVLPLPSGPRPRVSPLRGGKHDNFRVFVVSEHETGVFGKTRRIYSVDAHAVHPRGACVTNRDRIFPAGPAGETVYAELEPRRGQGGPLGWCRGLFRGTVRYHEAFACPATGRCRIPRGFRSRSEVIVRFSFRVI